MRMLLWCVCLVLFILLASAACEHFMESIHAPISYLISLVGGNNYLNWNLGIAASETFTTREIAVRWPRTAVCHEQRRWLRRRSSAVSLSGSPSADSRTRDATTALQRFSVGVRQRHDRCKSSDDNDAAVPSGVSEATREQQRWCSSSVCDDAAAWRRTAAAFLREQPQQWMELVFFLRATTLCLFSYPKKFACLNPIVTPRLFLSFYCSRKNANYQVGVFVKSLILFDQ